jgi:radical SAM superfamily enzyme YgiQ (UPF0313 family)
MKVFLINPNSGVVEKNWAYKRFCAPIAPMGIGYMAAVLEKDGFEVRVVDQFASKISVEAVIGLVRKERPRVVGFSALTPVVPDIKRMAASIRECDNECVIVAGNIHATCFPEEMLSGGAADVVVRGEGEMTMLELCRNIRDGKPLRGVKGISYIEEGDVAHAPDRELIGDLDTLPFPAWHLFDIKNYADTPMVAVSKMPLFPVLASRGCPYRCYYCSQDKVYAEVRYRDHNCVLDEMEYFNRSLGVGYFGFSDAYFPHDEKTGIEFCRLLIKRGLHKRIRWCTETRVDKVSPELLACMKRAGAQLIMYGIEVGNAGILQSLDKGTTLEEARRAVEYTRKAGILTFGLFMIGLPGETRETCRETLRFAQSLNTDIAKFNIAVPYPGSRFFEEYGRELARRYPERFTSWADWSHFGGELVFSPLAMNSRQLRRFQREAMVKFYIRPGVIFRNLIKGTVTIPNLFFGGVWVIFLFLSGVFGRAKKESL